MMMENFAYHFRRRKQNICDAPRCNSKKRKRNENIHNPINNHEILTSSSKLYTLLIERSNYSCLDAVMKMTTTAFIFSVIFSFDCNSHTLAPVVDALSFVSYDWIRRNGARSVKNENFYSSSNYIRTDSGSCPRFRSQQYSSTENSFLQFRGVISNSIKSQEEIDKEITSTMASVSVVESTMVETPENVGFNKEMKNDLEIDEKVPIATTPVYDGQQNIGLNVSDDNTNQLLRNHNANIKDLKNKFNNNSNHNDSYYMNVSAIAEQYDFWTDHLTVRSFNMDLNNLVQVDPMKAQDAVFIMEELYSQQPNSSWVVQPDSACYTTVIDGWIEAGNLMNAEALLDRMEMLADTNHTGDNNDLNMRPNKQGMMDSKNVQPTTSIAPTEYTYMIMTQGWANDYKNDYGGKSAEKAEAILRRMLRRNVHASVKLWSIVLEGWCKRAGIFPRIAIQRAEALLNEMESLDTSPKEMLSDATHKTDVNDTDLIVHDNKQSSSRIDGTNEFSLQYETNSNATFLNSTAPLFGFMARRDPSKSHDEVIRPNLLTYTSFIGGLARSQENDLARQAEKIIERMETNNVQPDMVAYTAVLNCWSKAVSRREREAAATRSLYILEKMERMFVSKEMYSVKPSLITYSAAIAAIGNSLDPRAPELAEEVLQRMYQLYNSDAIPSVKPTTSTYNAVIYALSRTLKGNSKRKWAKRTEEIVQEMMQRAANGEKDVEPDVRTWSAVLRAWSRSGVVDAAENAQRVLDKLEMMYENNETNVRPNFVCYTTVMGAWGYSKRHDSLDKLEHILKRMEDGYEETLDADLRPNTVSYVTAIDAFIRKNKPDAAVRSQAIVDRMIHLFSKGLGHVRPTRTVFNVLIHAWSKSKEKEGAQNAEKIFKWMEEQYEAGDDLVRPDEVSLCAVLNAWANHAENGGADRALQIWEHTKSVSLEDRGVKPTITVPNIVIKAIARSYDPDAHQKAESILLQLEEDYRSSRSNLRPDVTTYSSVINACAYCIGNEQSRVRALETALRTFYKLCKLEDERPNNITFGTLFKAIQNLMPMGTDKEMLVRDLFDQCCHEGLVDSFVLSQVRYASPQLYRDLVDEPCGLGGPNSDNSIEGVLRNVPSEWSANVVE